ncbi:MAG: adenylate kinase [Deltaproteobacteria bacterium]|nr:MAG: adenylate kinase [Deltaproteobacteria bacterium]
MIAIVAGIPGAGKTTVMNEVLKKREYKVVNYGDEIFKIAKERKLVEHRDELRKLPYEMQREMQIEAAKRIAKLGNAIVDTHCTIKTPFGYLPGLPYDVLSILKPSRIILIEANPEEIMERRKKDAEIRIRDEESIESMEEHQLMNRIAGMSYAVLTGATLKIIKNRQGRLEEAAEEMIKALE